MIHRIALQAEIAVNSYPRVKNTPLSTGAGHVVTSVSRMLMPLFQHVLFVDFTADSETCLFFGDETLQTLRRGVA